MRTLKGLTGTDLSPSRTHVSRYLGAGSPVWGDCLHLTDQEPEALGSWGAGVSRCLSCYVARGKQPQAMRRPLPGSVGPHPLPWHPPVSTPQRQGFCFSDLKLLGAGLQKHWGTLTRSQRGRSLTHREGRGFSSRAGARA